MDKIQVDTSPTPMTRMVAMLSGIGVLFAIFIITPLKDDLRQADIGSRDRHSVVIAELEIFEKQMNNRIARLEADIIRLENWKERYGEEMYSITAKHSAYIAILYELYTGKPLSDTIKRGEK